MKSRACFSALFLFIAVAVSAQNVETNYKPYVATTQLYMYGNAQSMPVFTLGSADRFQLGFDDLEGGYKNYYYSYQLCDYNWQPATLSPFDYIKGFTINRINTYRYSSIAFQRYTHYQAILPDANSYPSRSGNYLLKVFLDGDSTKLVFTKQFLVVDPKAVISAQVVQPFTSNLFNSHQRVRFSATVSGINSFSPAQQVKAVVLQNYRWDNAQKNIQPTFVRSNVLEYNTENIAVFPGMKEWRWLNLTSFRLQSERVDRAIYNKTSTEIFVKTDIDRKGERYVYFQDFNGMYNISSYESINPWWQGDYATVNFSLAVPKVSYNIYLAGAFTHYDRSEEYRMKWNDSTGLYETSAFLKQGYYNYTYTTDDDNNLLGHTLEGNYWETENIYTVLLYYKGFADRNDQLIGISQINSRSDRPGFSF